MSQELFEAFTNFGDDSSVFYRYLYFIHRSFELIYTQHSSSCRHPHSLLRMQLLNYNNPKQQFEDILGLLFFKVSLLYFICLSQIIRLGEYIHRLGQFNNSLSSCYLVLQAPVSELFAVQVPVILFCAGRKGTLRVASLLKTRASQSYNCKRLFEVSLNN